MSDASPPDWLPESPLMAYLQRVQHPSDCSSRKFLVYTMPKINGSDTRNLGAMLTSLWRWAVLALEDDRTVVIDSTLWNMADCPHNQKPEGGLTCYFLPFSSCDMSHVLAAAPQAEHVVAPSNTTLARLVFRKHRVVKVALYSPVFAEETLTFDQGRISYHGGDCALMLAIVTYFFRFNTLTWQTISKNLKDSLPADFKSAKSIGMPIRASDKCMGHELQDGSAAGEMRCYDFNYYMKLAGELRETVRREEGYELDTIILTSEDPKIIEQSKRFARTSDGHSWRFVYNAHDVLQGTGSSTTVTSSQVLKMQNRTISRWDVATSMFTSLMLQLQGRFLITHAKSSFLLLMGFLHQYCDKCTTTINTGEEGEEEETHSKGSLTTVWIRPLLMCNLAQIFERRAFDVNHTASVFMSLPRDAIVADH